MINTPNFKDLLVVKAVEKMAEYLAKNNRLIFDYYDFHNKNYLFITHIFNNFRGAVFTHHDSIYVEMSKWKYFWNRRKYKHFNITRIDTPKTEEKLYNVFPIYEILTLCIAEITKEYDVNAEELTNLVAETYDDFYAEGDKKFVRNLY